MVFGRTPTFEQQIKQMQLADKNPAKRLVAEFALRYKGVGFPDERHGNDLLIDTNWLPNPDHAEPSPLVVHSSLWLARKLAGLSIMTQAITDIHVLAPDGGRLDFVTLTTSLGAEQAFLGPNDGGKGIAIAKLALEHIDQGRLIVPRPEQQYPHITTH